MIAGGNHTIDSSETSRPKGNESEQYRRTAQSRYAAGRQIAAPYELSYFACFHSTHCYRNRNVAGGWYPPLRIGVYHSTYPFKKSTCGRPSSVSPTGCQLMNQGMIATGNHLDSDSLRGAPPQGKLLEVAEAVSVQRAAFENEKLQRGGLGPAFLNLVTLRISASPSLS